MALSYVEQELQRACVTWFRLQYPKFLIHHSANGIRATPKQGSIFKKNGVLAGWPDLEAVLPGRVVYFEIKSKTGTLSQTQKEVHKKLADLGFDVYIIKDLDQFMSAVRLEVNTEKTLQKLADL